MKKRFVPFVRVENYTGLIAGVALKHWHRLPKTARVWIDQDDLINDGMYFARFKVLPYYDIKKAAFSTILKIMLDQHFSRVIGFHKRQKRTQCDLPEQRRSEDADYITSHESMVKLYWASSATLKEYVFDWFLSGRGVGVVRITDRFKKAKREFLRLAPKFGVSFESCESLLRRRNTIFFDNEIQHEDKQSSIN